MDDSSTLVSVPSKEKLVQARCRDCSGATWLLPQCAPQYPPQCPEPPQLRLSQTLSLSQQELADHLKGLRTMLVVGLVFPPVWAICPVYNCQLRSQLHEASVDFALLGPSSASKSIWSLSNLRNTQSVRFWVIVGDIACVLAVVELSILTIVCAILLPKLTISV
uniref:ARAD1D21648p n=1 Tax=Blastobotrys adeninivorans TaxID=409370 RepID=A0A060TFB2_BLAAD